jgi:hypothetical protein
VIGQIGSDQLEDALGVEEVTQPVLSQIP